MASRPWTVFEDALGQHPSLRFEDLNHNDISDFMRARFLSDREFREARERLPSFANQLLANIVSKASGVFLWVDLVVKSSLDGMRVGDREQDLQRRLDDLPSDLDKLYVKILHSLDPFYLPHAAQYFSLVETAREPLTLLQFALADDESPESVLKFSDAELTDQRIFLRVKAASRRLNNRCKRLLETERGMQSLADGSTASLVSLKIQHLHRTARDFIQGAKAQQFLQASINSGWDPALQLCLAYMVDFRHWTLRLRREGADEILGSRPKSGPEFLNKLWPRKLTE